MFFSFTDFGVKLELFTFQHFIAIIVFALIPCFLLYYFRSAIKNYKHEKFIRISIGVYGLIWEFSLYAWYIFSGGKTDWREVVPTTLCGLTIFISSYSMITLSKRISPIVYFFSFGAVLSFIAADINYGFDRYRFYAFFVIHGLIIFEAVYLRVIHRIKADKKAFIGSSLFLIPFLVVSIIVNPMLDMNLFYLNFPFIADAPVYTQIYNFNNYLFTLAVVITYYFFLLLMYGIAKKARLDD